MLHGHIVFDVTATSMIRLMSVTLGFRKSHQGRSWDIAATLQVRPLCDIAVRRCCDVKKCNHLWSLMGRSDVAATLAATLAKDSGVALATSPRHRRCDLYAISRCDVAAMSKSATICGRSRVAAMLLRLWPKSRRHRCDINAT